MTSRTPLGSASLRARHDSGSPRLLALVVRQLLQRKPASPLPAGATHEAAQAAPDTEPPAEERLGNREEIERLLESLEGTEAQIVRMYHLEGKSYQEISAEVGMAENSVGPILSRARAKIRQARVDSTTT